MRSPIIATASIFIYFGLSLAALGCDNSRPEPPAQVPANIPVQTMPEGGQYQPVLDPTGRVDWLFASDPSGVCEADSTVAGSARQAVASMGQALAAIDYGTLSLPRFVTVTQKLKLDASSWNNGELELEGCALESGRVKWWLFGIKGPEFEQLPDQPLVHRWPHVYALYDVDAKTVTRLLATIRGYVLE